MDVAGTSISKSLNDGVLILTGVDSVESYQQVLRTLTYDNIANNIDLTTRVITTHVTSDSGTSAKVNSFVDVLPSLATPMIDLNGAEPGNDSIAFLDFETDFVAVAPELTLSTPNGTLESATITLTTRPNATDEILFAETLDTNIESSEYDENTGVLVLTGTDTVENYQRVLRTLEYIHFLESPVTADRLITLVVSDETTSSATFTAVVAIEPTPTSPVVDLNGAADGVHFSSFFQHGESAVPIVSSGASIDDIDSDRLSAGRVLLSEIYDTEEEFLLVDTDATNILSTYDTLTGVLTLTGIDTIANYEAVLRTLRYDNTAFRPSTLGRDVLVSFSDGEQFGTPAISFVDVGSPLPMPRIDLNGPELDGIDIVREYVEDSGPLTIAPNLTLTHAANTRLQFADVQLFDCFGDELCEQNESLSADTTGTNITATYSAEEGRLVLDGPDSIENYERVLRTVAYENRSQAFEFLIEELDFFAIDVDGEDNTWTLATLEMKPTNDAPILDTSFSFQLPVSLGECDQTPEQSQGIFEDDLDSCFQQKGDLTDDVVFAEFYLGNQAAAEAFDDVDLFFMDFEEGDALQFPSIAVVGVDNTNGQWQFSTDSAETWRTFVNVSESSAVLLSSDISNRLRFVPNNDFNGTIRNGLSFRVWDQTTANPHILEELKRSGRRADTRINGGTTAFSQNVGEVSITVFPVNDAPTFIPGPSQAVEADAGPQVVADWATNISAGAANENAQSLEFIITVTNPELFIELPAITPDGTLRYTLSATANGTSGVRVQLKDDGGVANGGIDLSSRRDFDIRIGNPSIRLGGDANLDGVVAFADFLILAENFGISQGADFRDGDFDEDGDVDFTDFLMLAENFGRSDASGKP